MGSTARPLLIATTVAGPDLDGGAVGGALPGHIQTQPGLHPNHRAIAVEGPLLVRPPVAVPDLHTSTCRPVVVEHVEALVAIDLQLAVGERRPLLVAAPIAVPDVQERAVVGGSV